MLISAWSVMLGWVVGTTVVAANPSPYFAAFGLVFVAAMGGFVMLLHGGSYLCFVLLLVYLGGMLVVFAYTSAMAADPYPETLGSPRVVGGLVVLGCVSMVICVWLGGGWGYEGVEEVVSLSMFRADTEGVGQMYSLGGWGLMVCGWGLLLTLFVVMELTRGPSRGALRAV
uniref:NADH-ubiquinone oxidoreductase chain 6 n=1 Tax=Apogonichthyoides taeniatus TaxID=435132 RepID=A0A8F2YI22_9TELE|nr:NADH dehydrogenase subunit 6 [Apogonichthyoides taeniatus]